MNMRPLSENERNLITRFAAKLSEVEGAQLIADAAHATAKAVTPDASRIMFQIDGYNRPPYRGQHPFRVEGRMNDSDAVELSVSLYADENGRLLELEFIRWDSKAIQELQWQTLQVF